MPSASRDVIEGNLLLARRFIEDVLGGGNPNSFDELVSDHIRVVTSLKPTGPIEGKAEYVKVLGETVSGQFIDREVTLEELSPLQDGRILAHIHTLATHVGEVFGIPPTNRRIRTNELLLMRFNNSELVELLVGSLIPMEFEMLFAPAIAASVLGRESEV